jgi:hypothetical protein
VGKPNSRKAGVSAEQSYYKIKGRLIAAFLIKRIIMPVARKNTTRKPLKKRAPATIIVHESKIAAKDTLFPEKVARANKILKNTKFYPGLGL